MKKLFKLILVFIPFAVFSQTATENYVKKTSYKVKTTNGTTKTTGGAITNEEKQTSITYFDGLGRAKQSIQLGSGGNKEDLIIHFAYDQFGRQIKEFLPYASGSYNSSIRTGSIENLGQQFYLGKFPNDFTGMTSTQVNSYSEKTLEKSPLNRILEQGAPGKDWKIGNTYAAKGYSNGSHTIKFEYDTNAANEVRLYSVLTTFANNTYTPTLQGGTTYYAAGELIKTITKDENWQSGQVNPKDHTTEEFKNKQGQVVLKRTYNNNIAHDTFYVYDDFGSLTYVIPPKAEGNLDKPTTTELNELCYQYKYDQRNRLVEKKIPGKGWEYIVYNKLDQPSMTQDAVLDAQNKWLITKYDQYGRVAYTGEYSNSGSRISMQNNADANNYQFETRIGSPFNMNGVNVYYTKNVYPNTTGIVPYTINYYDTYVDLPTGFTAPTTVYNQSVTTNAKGLPTVNKTRVLGTSSWITTITYYDVKGRAIYVYSKNDYLGTTDIVESKLDDFTGKVLETKTTHTKSGNSPIVTRDYFEYDHMDRVKKHSQNVNSATYNEVIAENTYDNLGQLNEKKVGGKTNQSRLQNINYSYNVRGWLKQINDPNNLGTDLFGFKINYNSNEISGSTPLFNGNISETIWQTSNDQNNSSITARAYSYNYDALNRIKSGNYKVRNTSGSYNALNGAEYLLTSVGYDKNGNITHLYRRGDEGFNSIDYLTYYYDSGNKLLKVSDGANSLYKNKGFVDGTNTGNDFTYDQNGNMITDQNKGITNISYNHLNLPTQVTLGGQNINYVYDASGVKLRKTVQGVTTDYAGNYIYENNTLQFFNHPEGYVKKDGSAFNYVYQYKDHLGNVRLSYTDKNQNNPNPVNIEIIEESNYYPFGLKHKGYNDVTTSNGNSVAQKKGFQEQMLDDELGLNWYSYKYRNYDPSLARFHNIDPLTEDYMDWGPYVFSGNRVIDARELEGLEPLDYRQFYAAKEAQKTGNKQIYKNVLHMQKMEAVGTLAGIASVLFGTAAVTAPAATATFIGNEVKDEVLSFATNGASDIFDITKIATKGVKKLVTRLSKNTDGAVVIGEGMDRVNDAASVFKNAGLENVGTFKPSAAAQKKFDALKKGLKEGESLSDAVVKGTKLFKENQVWIKKAKSSGKTVIDIGRDGRKNKSTFYNMERETVYDK